MNTSGEEFSLTGLSFETESSEYLVILLDSANPTAEGRKSLAAKIKEHFSLSSPEIEQIFAELPAIFRKESSAASAQQMKQLLEELGGIVEISSPAIETEAVAKTESMKEPLAEIATPDLAFGFESLDESLQDLTSLLDAVIEDSSGQLETTASDGEELLNIDLSPEEQVEPNVTTTAPVVAAKQAPIDHEDFLDKAFAKIPRSLEQAPAVVEQASTQQARFSKQTIMLIAFLASLTMIMLGVLIYQLNQNQPKVEVYLSDTFIQSLLKEQERILNPTSSGDQAANSGKIISYLTGRASTEIADMEFEIAQRSDGLELDYFTFSTPPPPALTPKEIVDGKPPPVWLRRFEADNNVSVKAVVENNQDKNNASHSRFALETTGRAYLEDTLGSNRAKARLILRGEFDENMITISGAWTITNLTNSPPLGTPNSIKRLNESSFEMLYRGDFKALVRQSKLSRRLREEDLRDLKLKDITKANTTIQTNND